MADQPLDTSVADIFQKTVVLAFELAKTDLANSPQLLDQALRDPAVDGAIRQALNTFALQNAGKMQFNGADAQKLGQALVDQAGGKLSDAVLKKIQNSPEYKQLEKSVGDLENALKTSPGGAWVDKNKGILYIAAAIVGIGGAALLYIKKPDSKVLDFAAGQLGGKQVDIVTIGGVKLGAKLIKFQPSTRTAGAGATASVKLSKVDLSFEAGLVAVGPKVDQIKAQAIVKTHDGVSITVDGSDSPATGKIDLGLSVGITGGKLPGPLDIRAGVIFEDKKRPEATLNASLKTGAGNFGVAGSTDGKSGQILGTWSIPF